MRSYNNKAWRANSRGPILPMDRGGTDKQLSPKEDVKHAVGEVGERPRGAWTGDSNRRE